MKLPRRRSSRPRGRARLALAGDFHASDRDIAKAIEAAPPAPWDGTTMPLSALRDQPRYAPADFRPAPAAGPPRYTPPDPASHPYPAPPTAVLPLPQARAVMTVNPPRPGGPGPTPEALEVTRYLRARVVILKRRGHADRISDEKLAMLPAMRQLNRRTTALLIVDEAAELLRHGGDPR